MKIQLVSNARPVSKEDSILLRVSEVALLLGVSKRTVWRLIRSGRLPLVRLLPRTVRVYRSDVEELIKECTYPYPVP